MYKLIVLLILSSLAACAAPSDSLRLENKNPRGISIINISKNEHAKAYRMAEKHCAKYYKVPQLLKTSNQSEASLFTMKFRCLKPSK